MNKTELIGKIAENAEITKVDAKRVLDATLEAVKDALAAGDKIALVGFGTLSVVKRAAHEGRNPQTKEKTMIPEKNVVKFKAGAELTDSVN